MPKKHDLPSMPFYFGDWMKAPEIRALELGDRMIWFEMMGFMWESTERGYLTLNSKPIPEKVLARMLGIDENRLSLGITHLEELEVFSRRKDGAIFSRRMVKDNAKREMYAKFGQKGGNPLLRVKGQDNPPNNSDAYPAHEHENEDEHEDVIEKKSKGKPTSVNELSDCFAECGGNSSDVEDFWMHYETNGWKVGKVPMKNWRMAVKKWIKRKGEFNGTTSKSINGNKSGSVVNRAEFKHDEGAKKRLAELEATISHRDNSGGVGF